LEQILNLIDLPYKQFYNFYLIIEKSKLIELKKTLFKSAIRYSSLRSEWMLLEREERKNMDEERSRAHNVFIDDCNIMSRNMIANGEDASWRKELGNDRKVIGDFACYISFVLGIKAR
jgi:hypothetical protein